MNNQELILYGLAIVFALGMIEHFAEWTFRKMVMDKYEVKISKKDRPNEGEKSRLLDEMIAENKRLRDIIVNVNKELKIKLLFN